MPRDALGRFALVGLLALLSLTGPSSASAGWRELELLVVNMTPAPTDAGRRCFQQVLHVVRGDTTILRRMGETRLRTLVGDPDGDFMSWDPAALRAAHEEGETWLDTLVLVDCRPEDQRLDIYVSPPARDRATLRLRGRELSAERVRASASLAELYAWSGFTP